MDAVTGAWRRRISSSSTEPAASSLVTALLICAGSGTLLVAIDTAVRVPLRLPGHMGLTSMALLVMARCLTRQSWGASAAAATAALISLTPVVAARPGAALLYLLPGLVIDACCRLLPAWRERAVFLAAAAGLANGSKAVALWLAGGVGGGHGNPLSPD
jgi:hypothetical protein